MSQCVTMSTQTIRGKAKGLMTSNMTNPNIVIFNLVFNLICGCFQFILNDICKSKSICRKHLLSLIYENISSLQLLEDHHWGAKLQTSRKCKSWEVARPAACSYCGDQPVTAICKVIIRVTNRLHLELNFLTMIRPDCFRSDISWFRAMTFQISEQ